ncbi:MAG: CoA-transferase, partial [Geminicoccaceae bacterium]|nr:CoA-transferase [Geminicoccaceae bacterium]
MTEARPEELLIALIARLLAGSRHVAVGVLSPIPGAAALLLREVEGAKVSIIGSRDPAFRIGSVALFDLAAQGRIDAFFLSGGQIDGQANVNLVGVGDYPEMKVRWSGSFGSAFLYHLIPKVILFRLEHSPRTLAERVDFVSAAGRSEPGIYRPGGPHALVTDRALFRWQRELGRFRLVSVHPGNDEATVRRETGFEFDVDDPLPTSTPPDD